MKIVANQSFKAVMGAKAMPAATSPAAGNAAPAGKSWNEEWAQSAQCLKADPDALFVQGAAQQEAKLMCVGCPVIAECLADALDNEMEFGVWGGLTERERRALLKRRPDIRSWRAVFEDARLREQRQAS